VRAASIASVSAAAAEVERDPASVAYLAALASQPFVRDLLEGTLTLEWTPTIMVSDDPAKALGQASDDALVWTRLKQLMGAPVTELQVISPYLVPGNVGRGYFAALAKRGVKVTMLTNSLEATDVALVHAGYARHRKPLLESGITLFELKRMSSAPSGGRRMFTTKGSSGSSSSSLHAKTFAIDRSRVFVGSFNFDPRSARLNTELGFVMDSPVLAQAIADAFAERIPQRAYGVHLRDAARLQWIESSDSGDVVYDREPGTRPGQRLAVAAFSLLPIEWLL
jgi:putative cardiolipin synthase